MANYRVCFRLPTFVVQLSFEAAERDISYEEIAASIDKEKVAELLCLDALGYSAEDIEIITPEEYDEEVGAGSYLKTLPRRSYTNTMRKRTGN